MDDDFSDLETELKALRPRTPSRALQARISAALAEDHVAPRAAAPNRGGPASSAARPSPPRFTTATTWTSWKWATWSAAASLTLFGSAFAVWQGERFFPPTLDPTALGVVADRASYKPVAAEKVLYESLVEGIVTLADGTTGRQVRDRYVDTITWRNPATRASLTWSVPRDEVRVVPVTFN